MEIEQDQYPFLQLSKSLSYFQSISFPEEPILTCGNIALLIGSQKLFFFQLVNNHFILSHSEFVRNKNQSYIQLFESKQDGRYNILIQEASQLILQTRNTNTHEIINQRESNLKNKEFIIYKDNVSNPLVLFCIIQNDEFIVIKINEENDNFIDILMEQQLYFEDGFIGNHYITEQDVFLLMRTKKQFFLKCISFGLETKILSLEGYEMIDLQNMFVYEDSKSIVIQSFGNKKEAFLHFLKIEESQLVPMEKMKINVLLKFQKWKNNCLCIEAEQLKPLYPMKTSLKNLNKQCENFKKDKEDVFEYFMDSFGLNEKLFLLTTQELVMIDEQSYRVVLRFDEVVEQTHILFNQIDFKSLLILQL